jgi:outer membrane autotransporter protein
VGKTYSTDTTSEQDSQTQNISLGFDRIIKDDNQSLESAGHIVGVVLGIGKSDADTTNNSTVDADSYSISTYGVIRQDDKELVQAQIGYGHIKVDKTRIDGSDTLTGSHNANQFFTSLMVKRETMNVGSFSLSPYGKIQASRTWYDGYSESGGATALTYGEQTIDSTVLSAGVDVDYMIPIHKGNIRPFAKFEYGADVSGSSTVNMHYNNEVTNYQLQLDNKADSNWKFVLGADMYTKEEWDSSISYERTEAVDAGYSDSWAVKVGLKF